MPVEAVAYLVVLFGVCLLCHGETARCQPHPRWLTQYYTLISLGGAIGGISVALICPILFQDYRELPIAMSISMGVVVVTFLASRTWMATRCDWNISKPFALGLSACILLSSVVSLLSRREGTIERRRNFFGVLRVETFQGGIQLVHGSTIHGVQLAGNQNRVATSYYGAQSGIGRAIVQLQESKPSLRIGVVGLGCGVLATYGRPSDHFDMYEINPDVLSIAQEHFTFLSDCESQIQHHLGDGRLLLERPETPKYDLLVLDAFSSDAIPAHLLTLEAMQLYADHLSPGGVVAVHLSNNHLDLVPLTHRLAWETGMSSRSLRSRAENSTHTKPARWVIACDFANQREETEFWANPLLVGAQAPTPKELAESPLWTDQHHNLASVLNWSL